MKNVLILILVLNGVVYTNGQGLPLCEQKDHTYGLSLRADPDVRGATLPGKRTRFIRPVEGVDATIIFVEWSDIQPDYFGEIQENNVIDTAIQVIQDWNASHPEQPMTLRLRVYAGIFSPQWVMNYAGSVNVDWSKNPGDNPRYFRIPKFWTNNFRNAWEDFQVKLSAKYDDEPLINAVSIAGQATLHSEVTWRHYTFNRALQQLVNAGLRFPRDKQLWMEDITFMFETWKKTPIEMTFNAIQSYTVGANNSIQLSGDEIQHVHDLLDHLEQESIRLNNKRYSIGNHSLKHSTITAINNPNDVRHVLVDEGKKGVNLYFQTEVFTADVATSLLNYGADFGASLIELPNDIREPQILSSSIQAARARLKANAPTNGCGYQVFESSGQQDGWSNCQNWQNGSFCSNSNTVLLTTATSLLDENVTTKELLNSDSHYLKNGSGMMTININSNNNKTGISNHIPAGQFKIDASISINNNLSGRTLIGNDFNNGTLEFGSDSNIDIESPLETYGDQNTSKIEFNGTLSGSENLFLNNKFSTFGHSSNNAEMNGNIVIRNIHTLTINTADNIPFIHSGIRIQVNSNDGQIVVNGENVIKGDISLGKNKDVTFIFNNDQFNIGKVLMKDESKMYLEVSSNVESLYFDDMSAENWGSGEVEIVGFQDGVIRVGTSSGGLSNQQLNKITANGHSVVIDNNGFLHLENSNPYLKSPISREIEVEKKNNNDHKQSYLKVYPNPVVQGQELRIESDFSLNSNRFSIYNVIGKEMYSSEWNIQPNSVVSINTHSLTTGMYVVKDFNGNTSKFMVVNH